MDPRLGGHENDISPCCLDFWRKDATGVLRCEQQKTCAYQRIAYRRIEDARTSYKDQWADEVVRSPSLQDGT
jgi:hypothetical protein